MRHKTKRVKYKGRYALIDANICELITTMWKHGINTNNCCESHCSFSCGHKYKEVEKNYFVPIRTKKCLKDIWVTFDSMSDIEKLFNIISIPPLNFQHDNKWQIRCYFDNLAEESYWGRPIINGKRSTQMMRIDKYVGVNDFKARPQLTFPKNDVALVLELLKKSL